ncbi:hypothetical protein A0130_12480 [Leifsonia xyli]|uniref:DUF1345 domain-containing protein n=1 Tax=Leifsonia xyli TaxID=1575 RepID=UPI0007CDD084|nr:hypothetical protein A0130_12480 [Leifsonia xyli]
MLLHAALIANLALQLTLAVLGVAVGLEPTAEATIMLLAWWSGAACVYLVGVVIAVTVTSRAPRTHPTAVVAAIYRGRSAHLIGAGSTVLASLCGVAGAVQVTWRYADALVDSVGNLVGVAAMLLSWGLLHWGYAQSYYRRHHRSLRPVLVFPDTPTPRLSDFVYFAFTVGTAFATSDAKVLSPRLRWTVTKHAILSFFYNGAIIVLALNTLTSGGS